MLALNMILVQCNYYRRTHLITPSVCKICLVTYSTCLTTRSTRSTRFFTRCTYLSTRSTPFSARSTSFSTRNTRLSILMSTRSTRLSTHSICLSTRNTRSTICQSFYNWSLEVLFPHFAIFCLVHVEHFWTWFECIYFITEFIQSTLELYTLQLSTLWLSTLQSIYIITEFNQLIEFNQSIRRRTRDRKITEFLKLLIIFQHVDVYLKSGSHLPKKFFFDLLQL